MIDVIVFGTGGLAREFTAFFEGQVNILGYVSTETDEHRKYALPGKLFPDTATAEDMGSRNLVAAIGSPTVKRQVCERMKPRGFEFVSLVHPFSVLAGDVELGEGAIVSPNSTIGAGARLGKLNYINFNCGIGHDVRVEDFVQVNPGAQIGGFVEVAREVLIGSNATIRQGLKVGAGATIGSGAVVLSRVADGVTVIGNPARRLRLAGKQEFSEE